MGQWISGRDALMEMDTVITRLRGKLTDALTTTDTIEARLSEIQSEQIGAFRQLAHLRLDLLKADDLADLDSLHQKAENLLAQHADYVARERASVEAASQDIAAMEISRAEAAQLHERIRDEIQDLLQTVENQLKNELKYKQDVEAFETQKAISERAHQKLIVAQQERDEKSQLYLNDPLFSYLWQRQFGTPDYTGSGVTRWLDGWVARLCKYQESRPNFTRLNEIPDWLSTHAEHTEAEADAAKRALEEAERAALDAAGVQDKRAEADAVFARIASIDTNMRAAETRHAVLAEQHANAQQGADGPAEEARKLLESGLRRMSFPDLRQLAAETVTLDDDKIVDRLIKLRTEEMSLELEDTQVGDAPKRLQSRLNALEGFRRSFKQARYDRDHARLKGPVLDDVLYRLNTGQIDVKKALKQVKRSVRYEERQVRKGFGGWRDEDNSELFDILETVAEEAIRHGMRSSGYKFPKHVKKKYGRSRSKRTSRRGGGFKTGGGF